jgi:hypothetical protein
MRSEFRVHERDEVLGRAAVLARTDVVVANPGGHAAECNRYVWNGQSKGVMLGPLLV